MHLKDCPYCAEFAAFPNVRAASSPSEKTALGQRMLDAEVSAAAGDFIAELQMLGDIASSTSLVISKSLSILDTLVRNDNLLMATFHKSVRSNTRLPENNEFDQVRASADSALFPHYAEHIHFGALSTNGAGVGHYGSYSITFKEEMIRARSSVFNENPLAFFDKHGIVIGKPIPPGYRASWEERHLIAMAKLFPSLKKGMVAAQIEALFISQASVVGGWDYIEVHTYGDLNVQNFKKIVGQRPTNQRDRVIWNEIVGIGREKGIEVIEA